MTMHLSFPSLSFLASLSARRRRFVVFAPLVALCALLCLSVHARGDDALYRALGEKPGLQRIVDGMVENIFADPRVLSYFEGVGKKRFKTELVDEFCMITGGPCVYGAHDIKRVHAGLHVDRAAFDAVVEDLQAAMDSSGVPFRTQNRLLARLAPMHRDIEER